MNLLRPPNEAGHDLAQALEGGGAASDRFLKSDH